MLVINIYLSTPQKLKKLKKEPLKKATLISINFNNLADICY
jgi:hypothetical protein